jgi:alkanesulfonate monooxygenase SsuD/methylene tetrahydromethanopterin reductase-like flavin-dependent oxidoreductase (luciferase family)
LNPKDLKIGVQLPEVEFEYTWSQLSFMATLAEDTGFDSIWLGDHLMYRHPDPAIPPVGPFEAWTTLAALAGVTKRVELGPLVASLGFHNPAMIAKMAATIDQISNGRFILGVGSGWNEPEYRGYGFPFDHRVDRFEESFAVIRQFFETGTCTFSGKYVQIEDGVLFPRLLRKGGPPIMIGSNGKRMLNIAFPYARMWNAWWADYDNDVEKLPALLAQIDVACDAVGRDPSTLVKTVCPLVTFERGDLPVNPGRIAKREIRGDDPSALADELATYARLGIGHVQLVLDPIRPAAIEQAAKAIGVLRA